MTSTKALKDGVVVSNIFADDIKLAEIPNIVTNRNINLKS